MDIRKPIIITSAVLAGFFVLTAIILTLNLNMQQPKSLSDKNSVPVYFVKNLDQTSKAIPVRRELYKGANRLKLALSELLSGPTDNEKKLGYYSELPVETTIFEIKESPERITINVSNDFETGGGSASMGLRLEQLINTAIDSANKKPVYLEIEGEQVIHFGGEGIMVPQPLSKNLNRGQDL